MKALYRASVILFLVLIGTAVSQAQVKLGFVDTERIMSQMAELKDVEAKLKTLQSSYQDTLKALEANFNARLESYQKQQGLMTPEAKAKEEQQLKGMGDQFQAYYQDRLGPQGVLVQVQNQLLQPIRDKVRKAIEKVAMDEKLTAVMENATLIYFDTKLDITFKVLDYLRRGNN